MFIHIPLWIKFEVYASTYYRTKWTVSTRIWNDRFYLTKLLFLILNKNLRFHSTSKLLYWKDLGLLTIKYLVFTADQVLLTYCQEFSNWLMIILIRRSVTNKVTVTCGFTAISYIIAWEEFIMTCEYQQVGKYKLTRFLDTLVNGVTMSIFQTRKSV